MRKRILIVAGAIALLLFGSSIGYAVAMDVFNRWDTTVGSVGFSVSTHHEDQRNVAVPSGSNNSSFLHIACPAGATAIAGGGVLRTGDTQQEVPVVAAWTATYGGVSYWYMGFERQDPSKYPMQGDMYVTCMKF